MGKQNIKEGHIGIKLTTYTIFYVGKNPRIQRNKQVIKEPA
jgi:hypothetical protein